ncbi:amino acid ABC transporter ATP-binding protein [Chlorogloea sp. CCALA 695]|uniref:amino acid ABC transporter ATP-binding protein n=1 Tax=Chlorogloea sp. CCALA 695 TaxID=2107693 RepID=UPI0018EE3918|nr:amino acid ABC transporter ATP-binding protein [Chlorogloea sp. CCALA 695]
MSTPLSYQEDKNSATAVARSLAMTPEVMLFDEPTSALDPEIVKEVLQVMKDLTQRGIIMAIVTHEMGFAREVSDRILFLDQERLAKDATPKEFFHNPQCDQAKQFLEKML